jgi:hypothetical protein
MDLNKLKTKISITLCHILSEAAEGKKQTELLHSYFWQAIFCNNIIIN